MANGIVGFTRSAYIRISSLGAFGMLVCKAELRATVQPTQGLALLRVGFLQAFLGCAALVCVSPSRLSPCCQHAGLPALRVPSLSFLDLDLDEV